MVWFFNVARSDPVIACQLDPEDPSKKQQVKKFQVQNFVWYCRAVLWGGFFILTAEEATCYDPLAQSSEWEKWQDGYSDILRSTFLAVVEEDSNSRDYQTGYRKPIWPWIKLLTSDFDQLQDDQSHGQDRNRVVEGKYKISHWGR